MRRTVTLLAASLLWATAAFAQQTGATGGNPAPAGVTPVQPYQFAVACDQAFTATGAGNTTVTLTSGTPPAGTVFYVCTLDITEIANAAVTGAAGPAEVCTTTNLINNMTWWGENGTLTTGQMKPLIVQNWLPLALKSVTPGTAFTVACSGGQSTYNVRANMTGFFAKP